MAARLCGSGVVCYAIWRGELWLLLGRERDTPGWHQGSRRWSSFSGRAEGSESALQNAAREFVEEACAAVALDDDGDVPVRPAVVEKSLARAGVLERRFTTARGEAARHVTYVARVRRAEQPTVFAAFRCQLLRLDAVFRCLYRARKGCEVAPRMALPGFEMSPQLTTQDFEVEEAGAGAAQLALALWDGRGREVVRLQISGAAAAELRRVREAQATVRAYLEAHAADPVMAHPAVRVARVGGVVAHARVDLAYLEKSELRWFHAEELLRARLGGELSDNFRRCFVEALPDVVSCVLDVEGARGASVGAPGASVVE